MSFAVPGVSRVDIEISNNVWWDDPFQFGQPTDTSWSFTGCSFLLDVKIKSSDAVALLSLTSVGGTIVVDDAVARILHINATDHVIRAALPPMTDPVTFTAEGPEVGHYVYDLIMVTNATGERDMLMTGTLKVAQGVTIED